MNDRYAILIGVNDDTLKGCVHDVQSISNILKTKFHYKPSHIYTFTDTDTHSHRNNEGSKTNTKQQILSRIRYLATKPDIRHLWIHVSTHGKDVYGCSRFQSFKLTNGEYLSYRELFKEIQRLPSSCSVFGVMDFCHSGYMGELPYAFEWYQNRFIRTNEMKTQPMEHKRYPHMYILTSTSNEVSDDVRYKGDTKAGGAFTMAMVDALNHHDYCLCIPTLFKTIGKILKLRGHKQEPRMLCSVENPWKEFMVL